MIYARLADLVVVIHLAFVVFVLFGGLLVMRRKRLAWLHVPIFVWGAFIEFAGWICPLTPLEIKLRLQAGSPGYDAGFVDRYLIPVLYPENLTRAVQIALGLLVLAVNGIIYGRMFIKYPRRRA